MTHLTSILVLSFVLSLTGLTVSPVQAQSPEVGAAVGVTDAEGNDLGTITVNDINDPATSLDPTTQPEPGSRFVTLILVVEAASDQRFDFEPSDVVLQDNAGALWSRTSVTLAEDAMFPELSSQALAPGSRVSGAIAFALPEEAEIARVFYQPESNRLLTLADVAESAAPAIGQVFQVDDSAGTPGQIAILDVFDPFLGFDPGSPPDTGSRYLMVWLVLENPSPALFQPSASWFVVQDDSGYLWASSSVSRPAPEPGVAEEFAILDLTGQQLATGDRLSRAIFFEVPADAIVTGIYFRPDSSYLIPVADLGATEPADEPADEPAEATPFADYQY